MIKIGRRGSLTGRLTVAGRQGHVAYPHLADNPIPGMLRLLAALIAAPLDDGTAHFERLQSRSHHHRCRQPGHQRHPGRGARGFNIRFNDVWTPRALGAELATSPRGAAGDTVRFDLRCEPDASRSS